MRIGKRFKNAFLLLGILTMISLTGCANEKKESKNEKLQIVTTLFPNYDFAKQIVGDKGEVTLLLKPGTEAHDYDPTPSDVIKINQSDLFLYTGDGMEVWAGKIIASLESKTVHVVDVSEGIEQIDSAESDETQAVTKQSDLEEDEHEHEQDPHIWTSPKNAMIMMNTILEAIVSEDPENESYYRKNAAAYLEQIKEIDREMVEVVKNAKYKTIYFGGRFAMLYFVKEYGLGYLSAFDSCSSETEPSAKLVTRIVDAMKKNGATIVYYEELADNKTAKAIAEEVHGETLLLHSCHNVSAEDFEKGVTYVSLMKQNIENLKIGLGEGKK